METKRTYVPYWDWKEKSKQTEYTEATPLLNKDGTLNAKGWARHNVFDYDRTLVKKGSPMSKKEWDFYQISDGKYMLQLSFANIGIGGYVEDFAWRTGNHEYQRNRTRNDEKRRIRQ